MVGWMNAWSNSTPPAQVERTTRPMSGEKNEVVLVLVEMAMQAIL
jgi:hypothetical protein